MLFNCSTAVLSFYVGSLWIRIARITRPTQAFLLGIMLMIGCIVELGGISLSATPVYADGCLVPDTSRDIYQPAQKAIIEYENGRQELILQVKYEGDADRFAWIIPVPSYPDVDATNAGQFEQLAHLTAVLVPVGGSWFGCSFGADGDVEPLVDVWEEDFAGIYEYAVLSAKDPQALLEWLNTNGYLLPQDGPEIVNHYIEKEWYFVAIKINTGEEAEGLAEGTIQPLKLSFVTSEPIYPLKITSLSSDTCEILLYIIANKKVVTGNYPYLSLNTNDQVIDFKRKDNVFYLEYAEQYSSSLSDHSNSEEYLTKMRARITADNMVDIELVGYEEELYPDSDDDGWSDEEEVIAATDPNNVDTDGDGIWDPEDTYPVGESKSTDWLTEWLFSFIFAALVVGFIVWLVFRRGRTRIKS